MYTDPVVQRVQISCVVVVIALMAVIAVSSLIKNPAGEGARRQVERTDMGREDEGSSTARPLLDSHFPAETDEALAWKLLKSPPLGSGEILYRYVRSLATAAGHCRRPLEADPPDAFDDARRALAKRIAAAGQRMQALLLEILRGSPHREGALVALAIDALSRMPPADDDLLAFSADREAEPWVRRHAAVALGQLRASVVPGLVARARVRAAARGGTRLSEAESVIVHLGHPAVPHLISALESEDEHRRLVAARCLSSIGFRGVPIRSAAHALVGALADPAPRIRSNAASALGEAIVKGYRPPVEAVVALRRALRDQEPEVCRAACHALCSQTSIDPLTTELLTHIRDRARDEAEVRCAVLGLAKHAPSRIRAADLPVLVADLRCANMWEFGAESDLPEPAYRRLPERLVDEFILLLVEKLSLGDCQWPTHTVSVLCDYGPAASGALETLRVLVQRPERTNADSSLLRVFYGVRWALWIISDDGLTDLGSYLHKMLEYRRAWAARVASRAQGKLSWEEVRVLRVREDEELADQVSRRPMRCAAFFGERALPLFDVILSLAEGPKMNREVFMREVEGYVTLVKIGVEPERLIPILLRALNEEWPRAKAAEALGLLGPAAEEALAALVRASSDKKEAVRVSAATALGQIGTLPNQAVPALIRLLDDPEEAVRAAACSALGRYGQAAADAEPHLERLSALDNVVTTNTPPFRCVGQLAFTALGRVR